MTDRSGEGTPDEGKRVRVTDKRQSAEGAEKRQDEALSSTPGADDAADDAAQLAEERLDQLMRLKADFENYRKRVIREQTDLVERASLRIVERLLPVLDNLDRARQAASGNEAILRGIELVAGQLHDVLVDEGLERVQTEGAFDPHQHEAVSSSPAAVDEPTVLEVVRTGYKLKGKTIRPALVHVSVPEAGPESRPETAAEPDAGEEGGE